MRTRAERAPRRGSVLLTCLLSVALLTLAGCSTSKRRRHPAEPASGDTLVGAQRAADPPDVRRPRRLLRGRSAGARHRRGQRLLPLLGNYPSIVAKKLGAELDDRSLWRRGVQGLPTQPVPRRTATAHRAQAGHRPGHRRHRRQRRAGLRPAGRQVPRPARQRPRGGAVRGVHVRERADALLAVIDRTEAKVTGLLREVHREGARRPRCWWSATPRSCRPTTPAASSRWPAATTRTPRR